MKKSRREPEELPDGLTHNPFAALRPGGAPAPRAEPEAVEAPGAEAPVRGQQSADRGARVMRVRREKKGRRGKTVTRVTGGGWSADEWSALAGELKRALGCGAALEGDAIYLQGDLTARAASWLRKQRGVDCRIEN